MPAETPMCDGVRMPRINQEGSYVPAKPCGNRGPGFCAHHEWQKDITPSQLIARIIEAEQRLTGGIKPWA